MMTGRTDQAIIAYVQSEKVKAGIIWVSQCLDRLHGFQGDEKKGAEITVHLLLNMIWHEINLVRHMTDDTSWEDVTPHLERVLIMFDSVVGSESGLHLSKALSKVTTIGQRAMEYLKSQDLL